MVDEPVDTAAAVVALDGPSGTGKSTVARGLARRLGLRYLDTGAMYRAVTLAVLRSGLALDDPHAIAQLAGRAVLEVSTDPDAPGIRLDGADVSAAIRTVEVTRAVSAVSAVRAVRTVLVDRQRSLIGSGGIVVEGRDIGSVVWPQACPKVYLTASPEARARRRAGELGASADVAVVAADIARRDRFDSTRSVSPLSRADGAVELDTTELSVAQVIDRLVALTVAAGSGATPRPARTEPANVSDDVRTR
jgi:cytidylate kinase